MLDNEECWILKGRSNKWFWHARYDRYTLGQPATVAFDYEYVYAHERDIIGWLHTHPHWPACPSGTDDATMKAWCACLGRPLLCAIDGTDGLRCWWYMDDESDPIEVDSIRFRGYLYGVNPNGKKIHS